MQYYDYRMSNFEIKEITQGTNKGKFYVKATVRNVEFRMSADSIILLPGPGTNEMIDVIRSVFPKRTYNGTADIDDRAFNQREAEKQLRDLDGEDWTLLRNGAFEKYELRLPVFMKYMADLGDHRQGDWVLKSKNSKFAKPFRAFTVFVLRDGNGEYIRGWDPESRAKSIIANTYTIADAQAEGCPIDPMDLENQIGGTIPSDNEIPNNGEIQGDKAPF